MKRVAVVGASGYTGVELLRLLSCHPEVELVSVTSRQYAGRKVTDIFPFLAGSLDLQFLDVDPSSLAVQADIVFTAVPHKTAMEIIPDLLDAGTRVVDLSADFRLSDVNTYEEWYQPHTAEKLLGEAVYGLPELFREDIPGARLVANPGCYPTSAALALTPLLEKQLINPETLIIDSKSGASGAGRSAKVEALYCEVNEGFKAYGLPRHRHTPEIEQTLSRVAGKVVMVNFTPHLLPVNRGILSTCYADKEGSSSFEQIYEVFAERYAEEMFVRLLPQGELPNISQVTGSNFCDVGIIVDDRTSRVIAIAAIDNLVKGAAGQAIQNMNLMLGVKEGTGLMQPPAFP